ncbi:MAG: FprA family A-type flavoprotein, partial [Treponema sp.]|nr:FprA family A-type flavoprotein [Treponema sp.]
MTICDSVKYIGVDDHEIDLFEGQFEVPGGMAYNSYAVVGQKVCVMDSVDANFVQAWLGNIEAALGGKAPDFLVVQHMEMDHSAGVLAFAKKYPEAKIVSSKMAF